MTCISKGDEITHIYQGHFGDTEKEERHRILQNMFHFECSCTACVLNYPLARDLPSTYSAMTNSIIQDNQLASYFNSIREKLEIYNSEVQDPRSNNFLRANVLDTINKNNVSKKQRLLEMFKSLEEYHETLDPDILKFIEEKNIEGTLNLYYQKIRIASIFVKSPHLIFLNSRAAITDCLWVKYGNKAYGTSKSGLSGIYFVLDWLY